MAKSTLVVFKAPPQAANTEKAPVYENVFKLALDLKVPHKDIQELYRRMVFNVVFSNIDDHLKNHSFIYNKEKNSWNLAPAYDLTYPLNLNLTFTNISRALSINNKRQEISIKDMLAIAEMFSIKNPKGIIKEIQQITLKWNNLATQLNVPNKVIKAIQNEFIKLL